MNELLSRGTCLLGLVVFIGLAWSISTQRSRFPWRVVLGGLLLQFTLGVLVLRTPPGRWVFEKTGNSFQAVMSNVDVGSSFLFSGGGEDGLLATFAFGVLPTVIFFSSLMSVLYHLGVMQRLVAKMAWVMRFTLGTSGPETLAAAANVFVGHTEAPLVVKPYLKTMTRSELCAMMTGGFATVTGGLLGAYAEMGVDIGHLLTASVISAPAALLIAKVMVPDADESDVDKPDVKRTPPQVVHADEHDEASDQDQGGIPPSTNLIGAAVDGASEGMKLAINVAAMLIAFLALIALVDTLLGNFCRTVGWVGPMDQPLVTLGIILGYLGYPLAWLLGIPSGECLAAGQLIGLKTVANEFVAFQQLGELMRSDSPPISQRTADVLTYALAGFSNFAAIGIQVGGVGGLAPTRKAELAELGLRAMFGGLLACCMTGAIAGILL